MKYYDIIILTLNIFKNDQNNLKIDAKNNDNEYFFNLIDFSNPNNKRTEILEIFDILYSYTNFSMIIETRPQLIEKFIVFKNYKFDHLAYAPNIVAVKIQNSKEKERNENKNTVKASKPNDNKDKDVLKYLHNCNTFEFNTLTNYNEIDLSNNINYTLTNINSYKNYKNCLKSLNYNYNKSVYRITYNL